MTDDQRRQLIDTALAMRERAYAPYSKFRVGAAVLTTSGKIHGGCNVENASYGLTLCAERVAIVAAVAGGDTQLVALGAGHSRRRHAVRSLPAICRRVPR